MSLKDYRSSLMPHITKLVDQATTGRMEAMGEAFGHSWPAASNSSFAAPATSASAQVQTRSTAANPPTNKRDQHFLMALFAGFADISDSLSHLKAIDRALLRAPSRGGPLSRSGHLSFYYNAFLNEVFTLRERISQHLSAIIQRYRFESDSARIKKVLGDLIKLADASLAPMLTQRTQISAEHRYTHPEIERFRIIELTGAGPGGAFTRATVDLTYRNTKRFIHENVRENTAKVEGVVDSVFRVLRQLVMRGSGVRFPVR